MVERPDDLDAAPEDPELDADPVDPETPFEDPELEPLEEGDSDSD